MLVIHVSSRFKRSYKKLPRALKEDFAKHIEIFKTHPFHPTHRTHKLKGSLKDYYAFSLRNGYRVLFDFINNNTVILVNVGSHDDYKKWGRK